MTVGEHRTKIEQELEQAQQQAQLHGQQATQWAQRVLYLQGQRDLLNELDPQAPAPKPGDKGPMPVGAVERAALSRSERRRLERTSNGG